MGFMVDAAVLHRFAKILKATGVNYQQILPTKTTLTKIRMAPLYGVLPPAPVHMGPRHHEPLE